MNVLIISRCSKHAREESCRILDQFAERTGDAAWQTIITFEGANTLRRLLRKSARRNTAVACHWLKKNGQSELLWIVGNPRRFNAQGRVPTHRTSTLATVDKEEYRWQSAESIALLAAIAGLFHDFGKAGRCFQESLTGKNSRSFQPYRHEWISVRLFQAFVGEQDDARWLEKLESLTSEDETALLARLQKDNPHYSDSPFTTLPPLARVVAWLVLSHHRLPENLRSQSKESSEHCARWLETQLNVEWNALNHDDTEKAFRWTEADFHHVWTFPSGTPLQSRVWREKARQIARRARNTPALRQWGSMEQPFILHMARFCLMLADRFCSSGDPQPHWQDPLYPVWANSDRSSGALKLRVDEHLTGVAHHALLVGRQLMRARASLPAIARHKGFRQRAIDPLFQWQNKAWDVAVALRERSREQGFFGVNMASTGCGKTFANARIMYALADEQKGCRFTIALGLRTLTLQTGDALRRRLHLDEDDLAVLVGSPAVKQLWQQVEKEKKQAESDRGSASVESPLDEQQYVHYDGSVQAGALEKWLQSDTRLSALVSAPVLVATIDHLIPATEGVRGGKQLPAMLRLLSSDLILDEPDDFDIADLYAVCRLMNWAGMLGTRVLLSSATLPPELVQALFAAYLAGRKVWQKSCGESDRPVNICCAWFDEQRAHAEQLPDGRKFSEAHRAFVERRALMLAEKPGLHSGRIASVRPVSASFADVIAAVAQTVHQQILELHRVHKETRTDGKAISLGLVRFANIDPLAAVAKALLATPSPQDVCIHYCVYHARHPLAVRSAMEASLDAAFIRHDAATLWQHPTIAHVLRQRPETQHIFVVLGTSVMEVGRDWDASWGIIEPSSMRSIIQFAGRIQRHRRIVPDAENVVLLSRNIRALRNLTPAFCRPGFEDKACPLDSHDLYTLLPPQDYQTINALPRILPANGDNKLAELEHRRLRETLMNSRGKRIVAAEWWRNPLSWNAWMQRRTPFRQSQPEATFFLYLEDELSEPYFVFRTEGGEMKSAEGFVSAEVECAEGVANWGSVDYGEVLLELADRLNIEIGLASETFGEITVPVNKQESAISDWCYHPWLGVYRDKF
ncbi:type I-F CRISPR-associated helicase Cas3f [Intestinirhabdus alba]|jgi:CRISPR-associated endonuclease/helicase Cas3|uniref:Type I-F CRISPR-associated helicase Cas3 n=1 Tax=Intestinirhabdus alba TaxID=2899544 RepID=A0A6L6IR34_9ENTR|nr:type I-F CRISPR-associated helicase Cas3f [Intestinirhabdus alba]MTH48178.1 type I-F CRISPR-associated helicase Cas3 [Intestinirhabdus alba]